MKSGPAFPQQAVISHLLDQRIAKPVFSRLSRSSSNLREKVSMKQRLEMARQLWRLSGDLAKHLKVEARSDYRSFQKKVFRARFQAIEARENHSLDCGGDLYVRQISAQPHSFRGLAKDTS